MIVPVIHGHNLEGHILDTKVYPPKFIGTQTTGDVGVSVEMTQNQRRI